MVPRTVKCRECGETRVGRDKDGEVVPFRSECPNCGHTEFDVPPEG